jgi:chemotaxis protein CheC
MNTLLSEEQRDALQELMNISMGQAADALARLISTRIMLSIPRIISATPADFVAMFNAEQTYWFTRQSFLGSANGEVLTLLSKEGCDVLAEAMDYELPLDDASRSELILELANILAGACLSGFINQLELKTKLNMPTLYQPNFNDTSQYNWDSTLLLEVDFLVERAHFESRVVICLEDRSVSALLERLQQFIE